MPALGMISPPLFGGHAVTGATIVESRFDRAVHETLPTLPVGLQHYIDCIGSLVFMTLITGLSVRRCATTRSTSVRDKTRL